METNGLKEKAQRLMQTILTANRLLRDVQLQCAHPKINHKVRPCICEPDRKLHESQCDVCTKMFDFEILPEETKETCREWCEYV